EDARVLQPQLVDDVAADAFGRGRREGVERDPGKILAQPSELAILRTEVVSPLADAVRFVDRHELQVRLLEQPPQRRPAVADQPLGWNIQQAGAAVATGRDTLV